MEDTINVTSVNASDLATIPFRQQVALVGSADVMVGMHGAGMAQVAYLPCGAVVLEMRAAEHGVRSLAVKLDVGYVDWRTLYPKHDRDGGDSTNVDIPSFSAKFKGTIGEENSEQDPVLSYVGSSKNRKDLKDLPGPL
ncbi:hypothetical protein T484DRAFT_1813803 [Baffinella frigidus]|nr:hypothetical protein T484DRAFT_1813803 [Cryptophyta sp. CCMP2293]